MSKKVEDYVRSIPDFPEPGIIFRDVTSVIPVSYTHLKYKVSEFTGLEIKKINIYVEGVRVID